MKFVGLNIVLVAFLLLSCNSDTEQVESAPNNEQIEETTANTVVEEKPLFSKDQILKDPNLEEFEFRPFGFK